jgi:hypothetical protein
MLWPEGELDCKLIEKNLQILITLVHAWEKKLTRVHLVIQSQMFYPRQQYHEN